MKKLLLLLFLIPNLVIGESHTCNCSEIDCIDATYIWKDKDGNPIKNPIGNFDVPLSKTIRVKGILASKNVIDHLGRNFGSPILTFNKAKCIYGTFMPSHYDGGPGYRAPMVKPYFGLHFEQENNMTHVELIFDEKGMAYYKKNIGNEVLVTGEFKDTSKWNNTTSPFLFEVEAMSKKSKNEIEKSCRYFFKESDKYNKCLSAFSSPWPNWHKVIYPVSGGLSVEDANTRMRQMLSDY